jgi:hypothetical protein
MMSNPKMKVTGRGRDLACRLGLEQRGGSGCGFEGDLVPECLELADVDLLRLAGKGGSSEVFQVAQWGDPSAPD